MSSTTVGHLAALRRGVEPRRRSDRRRKRRARRPGGCEARRHLDQIALSKRLEGRVLGVRTPDDWNTQPGGMPGTIAG